MDLDDQICYCYHVSLRKLQNFVRREQPERPSQMSTCLGAGTGCGWCIPILKRIHAAGTTASPEILDDLTPDSYASARDAYRSSGQPRNAF